MYYELGADSAVAADVYKCATGFFITSMHFYAERDGVGIAGQGWIDRIRSFNCCDGNTISVSSQGVGPTEFIVSGDHGFSGVITATDVEPTIFNGREILRELGFPQLEVTGYVFGNLYFSYASAPRTGNCPASTKVSGLHVKTLTDGNGHYSVPGFGILCTGNTAISL
jgi:hypothetical protein